MTQKLKIDIVAKDRSKQALQGLQGSLGRLKASVFNLRNAFIGLGAGLVIKNIVNTGKQIENLKVQLKFLFGSAQEGAKAFDEMAKFASKVPFSLEEIQRGSGVLAVVSEDADELANLMKITGNVAAVTGLDFKTTAEQIQRSLSAGISAADLFRDKGVKDMLGFKAGATVSVEETIAAFERVFGEGGRFDGATDELAKTFSGTLSMIGDKVFNFKRVLLDAGFFNQLKAQFGDLNKSLEKNSETMDKIAITIGTGLAIAVEKLADGFKFMADHSKALGTAFKVLISLKIGFMLIRWGRALIPIVASMRALVSLSGVGLGLVAASVLASALAYKELGDALDDLEKKINKNFTKFKENWDFEDAKVRSMLKTQKEKTRELSKFEKIMKEVGEKLKENNDKFSISAELVGLIKSGASGFSKALAQSIVLGKDLNKSLKNLAQNIMVSILQKMIEQIALLAVQKAIQIALAAWEDHKKRKMDEQNSSLKKQIALQAILMMMGGGGGGGGGFFGFGKQHGGSVSKGRPVLVGERGPEMFIPNTSGQITQNARGTGTGSPHVTFNINAIDTAGFDELLIERRGLISSIINEAVNERGAKDII